MMRPAIAAAVFLSSLTTPFTAHAGDFEPYIGVSATYSDGDPANNEFRVDDDYKDSGFKIISGVNFNQYIGAQVFYNDIGEFSQRDFVSGSIQYQRHSEIITQVSAYGASIVLSLPIHAKINLFATLGWQQWDIEQRTRVTESRFQWFDEQFYTTETYTKDSTSGSDVKLGIGAKYRFSRISIQSEFERFKIDDYDLDILSLGAVYHF